MWEEEYEQYLRKKGVLTMQSGAALEEGYQRMQSGAAVAVLELSNDVRRLKAEVNDLREELKKKKNLRSDESAEKMKFLVAINFIMMITIFFIIMIVLCVMVVMLYK
jgi:CHASE3 domain sensor protein